MESVAPLSVEQELIERYLAALGGLETIRSIESMQVTGEVETLRGSFITVRYSTDFIANFNLLEKDLFLSWIIAKLLVPSSKT